jgi:hypothetical protein
MAEDVSAAVEVDGQLLSRPLYQFLQQQASEVGALTARFLVTAAECCKGPLRLALLRFLRSLAHASEGVFGAVLRRLLAVARALARAASGLASLQLRLAANDDLDDAVKASARLSARLTLLYGIVRLRSQSCIQLARPTRSPGLLMPELCLSSPGSGPRTEAGSPTRRSARPHRSLHNRADAEVHLLCSTELRAAILSFLNSAARGQQYVLLRSSGVGQSAAAAAARASLTAARAASAPLDAVLGDCSTSMHQQELQQQQPSGQEQAMASENLCGAPGIIGCDTPCMPSDDASGSPLGCSAAGGTVTGRQQQPLARGSSSGGGGGPRLTQSLSDVYMASWLPDAATEQLLLNSAAPGPVATAAPGEQLQQQQHAAMARGARRLSTPRNSWPAPVGGLHGPAGMVLMDGIASPRTPSQKQQAEAALRLAGCELGAGSAAGASLADVRLAPLSSFARSSVSGPLGGAGGGGGAAAAASSSSASALGSWVVEATHHPQQQPTYRAASQGERSGYTPPRSASPPIAAPACRGVRKAGKRLPAAPFSLGAAAAAAAGAATLPTAAPDSAASAGAEIQ